MFVAHFHREFQQGDHATILGATGSGKTTLLLEIIEARDHVLFLATKREDELIASMSGRGYRISDKLDIRVRDGHVLDKRFVFWPVKTTARSATGRERRMDMEEFNAYQQREIRAALNYVWHTRRWCVAADEVLWLTDRQQGLGLQREFSTLWYQGRSAKISLVAATQRPAGIPKAAYSSPEHIFWFATNDKDDLDRLADIGAGVDKQPLARAIASLGRYEFLYFRPRERPPLLVRSRVEL